MNQVYPGPITAIMRFFQITLSILTAGLHAVIAHNHSTLHLSFATEAGDCGEKWTPLGNAVNLTIHNIPRSTVCFHMGALIEGDPDATYRDPIEPCPDDEPNCGAEYTLSYGDLAFHADYQQVTYQQLRIDEDNIGRLAFTTYQGYRCLGDEEFDIDGPWHAWTCTTSEEGECSDLGVPFRSFSIGPVQEEWRNNGSCFIAAVEAGSERMGVSWLMFSAAVGLALAMI